MQLILQIRNDIGGIIGRNIRKLRDRPVEVDESLCHDFCLLTAIGALIWHTVRKCDVRADQGGGGAPLQMIVRDIAYEDQHCKASTKLIFLDVNADSPITDSSTLGLLGCVRETP
jgi:hypothetical protein